MDTEVEIYPSCANVNSQRYLFEPLAVLFRQANFKPSKLWRRINRHRDDGSANAEPSGFSGNIEPYDLDIARPKSKPKLDIGILTEMRATFNSRRLAGKCPGESVVCVNGFVDGTYGFFDEQTCKDACEEECCVGEFACFDFTGEVC